MNNYTLDFINSITQEIKDNLDINVYLENSIHISENELPCIFVSLETDELETISDGSWKHTQNMTLSLLDKSFKLILLNINEVLKAIQNFKLVKVLEINYSSVQIGNNENYEANIKLEYIFFSKAYEV